METSLKQSIQVMHLISSLEVGGAEKLLVEFLKEAASSHMQSNIRVHYTIVVMNDSISPDLKAELDSLGFGVYYLNRPEGHLHPKYLYQLLKIIHRHNIQVLHVHNRGSKLWGMLCKMMTADLKLVMTIHNTEHMAKLEWWQKALHHYLVDSHIAISKAIAISSRLLGFDNVTHIYNGIPLEKFRDAHIRRQPRSTDQPIRILNVARMDYAIKGQDLLISALGECKEQGLSFRCRLVGGVYEYNQASYEHLQKRVKQLGLSEEVEFIINQTNVHDYMADADVFVLPSRSEGLGLVVLEAMAAGLPVIAARTGGVPELVDHDITGLLFEVGDVKELTDHIMKLAQDPQRQSQLVINAGKVVQGFDIALMRRQYHRLYESLISRRYELETISNLRRVQDGASV